MRYPIIVILFLASCTSKIQGVQKKPFEIDGTWVLSKEIYEGGTLNYNDNPLKHVLALSEKKTFIDYSNIERFGIEKGLESTLVHSQGQFVIEGQELLFSHADSDLEEFFVIKKVNSETLVLLNQETGKESHYIKKNDSSKS